VCVTIQILRRKIPVGPKLELNLYVFWPASNLCNLNFVTLKLFFEALFRKFSIFVIYVFKFEGFENFEVCHVETLFCNSDLKILNFNLENFILEF
jgi:hypothetical protein